jgi:hypothetical protein
MLDVVRQFPMIMRGSSDASVGVNVRVAPGQTDLSKPIPPEREQFVAQNPKVPGVAQAQIESFVQSVNDMGAIKRHLGKVTEKPDQLRLIKFYVREQAIKVFSRQTTTIK